jgi:hypothetical protein
VKARPSLYVVEWRFKENSVSGTWEPDEEFVCQTKEEAEKDVANRRVNNSPTVEVVKP